MNNKKYRRDAIIKSLIHEDKVRLACKKFDDNKYTCLDLHSKRIYKRHNTFFEFDIYSHNVLLYNNNFEPIGYSYTDYCEECHHEYEYDNGQKYMEISEFINDKPLHEILNETQFKHYGTKI